MGFHKLTPEQRKKVASMGGKAAHKQGKAHKWSSEEAKIAGTKGGKISKRRPVKRPDTTIVEE